MGQRSANMLPILPGSYLVAALPDAASVAQMFAQVSDISGVGAGLMWSDGATWRQIPFSAQKIRVQTATDGTYTYTYPIAYPGGYIPRVSAIAEATSGSTDVINIQVDGVPTNTQTKFRVTRAPLTSVPLIGLTLAVPVAAASVGATWIHIEVFG